MGPLSRSGYSQRPFQQLLWRCCPWIRRSLPQDSICLPVAIGLPPTLEGPHPITFRPTQTEPGKSRSTERRLNTLRNPSDHVLWHFGTRSSALRIIQADLLKRATGPLGSIATTLVLWRTRRPDTAEHRLAEPFSW